MCINKNIYLCFIDRFEGKHLLIQKKKKEKMYVAKI